MEVEHKIQNDVLLFVPKFNSLDVRNSIEFREEMQEIILKAKIKNVVIDLSAIIFIDSSGLGCLISLLRKLKSEKGGLKLTGTTKAIRTVFELVSMDKIFEVYNNAEEAIQSFSPQVNVPETEK